MTTDRGLDVGHSIGPGCSNCNSTRLIESLKLQSPVPAISTGFALPYAKYKELPDSYCSVEHLLRSSLTQQGGQPDARDAGSTSTQSPIRYASHSIRAVEENIHPVEKYRYIQQCAGFTLTGNQCTLLRAMVRNAAGQLDALHTRKLFLHMSRML